MSHGKSNLHHEGRDQNSRRKSWHVKAILFLVALLVGSFDDALGGWAKPIAMAATALCVPILLPQGRKFWNQRVFWIIVLVLAIFQIPLVIAARPQIQRAGSVYLLVFGVADMLFVIAAILLVPKSSGDEK